ncbi:MAG: glycosyltransferase [Burkholderiaceae bacterium]|nr:MAG: glycosyltransferase [Burkholderiaceae bacterium]
MKKQGIHQFSFATSSGSGVTNSLFYTQKLLRELGFESDIFSRVIPDELQGMVRDAKELQQDSEALLLVHHCLGYDDTDWLWALPNPKVMVYHNITPPELLPPNSEIAEYARLGRVQLAEWKSHFIGAIGDSRLNSAELAEYGYPKIKTIPLLLDLEKQIVADYAYSESRSWSDLRDTFNVLFVGRICENKNQVELVEVIAHLRHLLGKKVRLILAGEVTSPLYAAQIDEAITHWNVQDQVVITGKLSENELSSLYRHADVFLCLSKHEGFGMPLIEAMYHGLPVIARSGSSIDDTLGGAGLLLPANEVGFNVSLAIAGMVGEPGLRRHVMRSQKNRLRDFAKLRIKAELRAYLRALGYQSENEDEAEVVEPNSDKESAHDHSAPEPATWQIEGPFDSSYSLAIVNRELARAMQALVPSLALRSHEGHGDFLPDPTFLRTDPEIARMYRGNVPEATGKPGAYPDVALRFCYPPYANHMPAEMRLMHSYGWEETGFPLEYVEEFNRRLDAVTVLSYEVKKILRDNGVRIPIVVTGAGVDHLQHTDNVALPSSVQQQLKRFNFLHISSSFPRKGVDLLIKTFAEVFTAQDDVALIIKTFPNPHNTVAQMLAAWRANRADVPQVILIDEDWPQAQINALYAASHAFVAPSRGEGVGLPLAEGMLWGLPVITTAWGGQTDFCSEQTAWLCDFEFSRAQTHLGLTHSLWAEPSSADLARHMKHLVSATADDLQAKLDAAQTMVRKELTWHACAERIKQAVAGIAQQPKLRKEPKIAWISTWNARCGIANYSHALTACIPPQRLTIFASHIPERTALDQANVIRSWNAQQSENFEVALEHIEEQGIGAVVIQYNFGFTSIENLARLIDALEQRAVAVYIFFHSTADVQIEGKWVSLSHITPTLKKARGLFVHGIEDMNRLKSWGLQQRAVYFPHGIDVAPSHAQTAQKVARFRDTKVIASYGFLLPHKGLPQLIEAFAQLDHERHRYHLLMVNALYPSPISDVELRHCQNFIRDLGLVDKVSLLTEYLPDGDTKAILANADLIVFPYQATQESSSAAVRTGLATGRPVAVTPLAIFDDVKGAVRYLDGTDPQSIATSLSRMLDAEGVETLSLEQDELRQRWFAERDWKVLSQRLLNMIDGDANDLGDLYTTYYTTEF